MAAQTSYASEYTKGFAGQRVYKTTNDLVVSKVVETAAIPFGTMVSRGTEDIEAVAGGTSLIGMAGRDMYLEQSGTDTTPEYAVGDQMDVIKKGFVWGNITAGTGAPGDAIYSVDATGAVAIGTAGAGQTQISGTLEETVTSTPVIAKIRLTY